MVDPIDPGALAAWVSSTLDEIERVTRAASPGPWHWSNDDEDDYGFAPGWAELRSGEQRVISVEGNLGIRAADAEHIALHDPAAVLARVEADQRIVRECVDAAGAECAQEMLRLLAWGLRHHPGYRPEWAPEETT